MSLVRVLREVLQGHEPSAHMVEEIIDALESESPVIRAAAIVAAFATINSVDYSDATVDELEASLKEALSDYYCDEGSNENVISCQPEHETRDSDCDNDNSLNSDENLCEEQRDSSDGDDDASDGQDSEADLSRDYEAVGIEKIPVTEPYGWGYKQYVVEVPVYKPKHISD